MDLNCVNDTELYQRTHTQVTYIIVGFISFIGQTIHISFPRSWRGSKHHLLGLLRSDFFSFSSTFPCLIKKILKWESISMSLPNNFVKIGQHRV